jgi:hypothetical protein
MQTNREWKMRMSTSKAVCLAAAMAVAAAVPATADAMRPAPPKQATFKGTLSGSQVTTWEYHHKKTDDGCDVSVDGNGDQTLKFAVKNRTFRITFTQPPKKDPDLFGTRGRPSVLTVPLFVTADIKAKRHGELSYGPVDHATCPGDNGGADGNYTPPPPDCGVRTGTFKPKLYFYDNSSVDDDELFVPLPGVKNLLTLDSWQYDWANPHGGSSSELRDTYERCPWELPNSYPDEAGHIYISSQKLLEKRLFDKKRKHFVVSGDHIEKRGGGESSGQTILAWNLHLTRVK